MNLAYSAVGALHASQILFVKALEDSNFAADADGPNVKIFFARKSSAIPIANGASGPIITK